MDQKYLTDSESLSLNIEATCLLLSSPRNFQYEIKTDKYNPYPSMISMFTSDSQHPPISRHAVHLGGSVWYKLYSITVPKYSPSLSFHIKLFCFCDNEQFEKYTQTPVCISMISCLSYLAVCSKLLEIKPTIGEYRSFVPNIRKEKVVLARIL